MNCQLRELAGACVGLQLFLFSAICTVGAGVINVRQAQLFLDDVGHRHSFQVSFLGEVSPEVS